MPTVTLWPRTNGVTLGEHICTIFKIDDGTEGVNSKLDLRDIFHHKSILLENFFVSRRGKRKFLYKSNYLNAFREGKYHKEMQKSPTTISYSKLPCKRKPPLPN